MLRPHIPTSWLPGRGCIAADISLAQQALEDDNLRQALDLLRRHIPKAGEPDLRGFEWRYLWRVCQGDEALSLAGHPQSAVWMAFSPKGNLLATCSADHTTKLWDGDSGRLLATLTNGVDMESLAFSPDGDLLAIAGQETVWIWDTKTLQPVRRLPEAVLQVRFSSDGKFLVTGATNGLIVWGVPRWEKVKAIDLLPGLKGEGNSLEFGLAVAPHGQWLAVTLDHGIQLLSIPDLTKIAFLQDTIPRGRPVAISPDAQTIASAALDHGINLWNVESGRLVKKMHGHTDCVFAMSFSADGKFLASASADQTVRMWDLSRSELSRTFRGHAEEVYAVAFSPDTRSLGSASKDGAVKIWNTQSAPSQGTDLVTRGAAVGFDALGNYLALQSRAGGFARIDPETFRTNEALLFGALSSRASEVEALSIHHGVALVWRALKDISGDGSTFGLTMLASKSDSSALDSSNPGWVELWDLTRHNILSTFDRRDGWLTGSECFLSAQAHLVALSTTNDAVGLWRLPGRKLQSVLTNCGPAVAFSADGTMLVTQSSREEISLWDLTIQPALRCTRLKGDFSDIEFSPNGDLLATASGDSLIRLRKAPSGTLTATLTGHKRSRIQLCFSPDGRTLASIADDSTVRFWHVATGRELLRFKIPGVDLQEKAVSFSPDGRALAAYRVDRGDTNLLTRIWLAPSLAEIALAEGQDYGSLAHDAPTWHGLGKALQKQGRWREAAEAFAQTILCAANHRSLEGFRTRALLHRSEVLLRLGQAPEAAADRCAGLGIPARSSNAAPKCVDLSLYFNGNLDSEPINPTVPPAIFLTNLPKGIQTLPGAGGVQFDIRGVIQLDRMGGHGGGVVHAPTAVTAIQIQRRCKTLHFLQGTGWREKQGTQIGLYRIHYADQTEVEVPIVYGKDTEVWVSQDGTRDHLQGTKVAWTGPNSQRGPVNVFARAWDNPRPDVEIESLDFESKLTSCAPFLIALTTEN